MLEAADYKDRNEEDYRQMRADEQVIVMMMMVMMMMVMTMMMVMIMGMMMVIKSRDDRGDVTYIYEIDM